MMPTYQLHHGDCLDLMKSIPDQSVDLILNDPPYSTTSCEWDTMIDLPLMWTEYRRIIKPNRPIVMTAAQPFTTVLAASNLSWFKYEWIWVKNRPTNFAHAKNKPMKKHENVLVFSEGTTVHASQSKSRMPYYPQGLVEVVNPKKVTKKASELTDAFFQGRKGHGEFTREFTNYPHSVLEFPTDQLGLHPTTKPIKLMEFLIQSYTLPGEIVLDNTMGSGTTGVAAANTGRSFVGMEQDDKYFAMSEDRIKAAYAEPITPESDFFPF
jgi:site-specific DNA-methyltransferase (adenine-specific)